ncbi:MAG: DUF3794 domain-containing protein [Ruminococcaceae bacterium]|nr:DUF3794 domain-containing protein [Oscillospiraceae bacterium]
MDNKALKTGVYYNQNIYSDTCEQPIDVDFTLPDYCRDISKIFKCKATARITSKSINGKNITVDGNICITLLYCDKDNNLCSYEYSYPFSKLKEMPEECDNVNLTARVKCDYINCRAVSGRKVDIHGAASIKLCVFKRCSNEIVADYEGDNVQLKRSVTPATIPMGYREKYLVVEEEINIGNAQAPIENLLRSDASVNINDCKVMNDKTVVKGELAVTLLYLAHGVKTPQILKTALPFSQIVEMAGITELCKCDIKGEIAALDVRPFSHLSGDCRSFSLNAKILLKSESYCVNDIAVIEDAFSTKFETELQKANLTFKSICENISEKCQFKKNIELNESISSVVDIWCEVQSKKVKTEADKICLSAVIMVGMLACDGDDNVFYCEKPLDFEWSHPISCESERFEFDPEIEICSVSFAIMNANCIELRTEMLITGAVYEKNEISLITDIKVDPQKPCCKEKTGGVVVCFSDDKACVWDIARKYNADIDEIMKINEIETDNFSGKKFVLVPIN